MSITQAQAVRSDWQATAPPKSGWQPVRIPEVWTVRWPGFSGVVWYQIEWNQADANLPTGLMLESLCLAGEVRINGTLVRRDASLVPPLSRTWNTPFYLPLSPPLLRAGRNTMLVRVSGLASYAPGIGPVTIGPADQVQTLYAHQRFLRIDSAYFNQGLNATLACFFLVLWLFRRQEVAFGWNGLSSLFWTLYSWNNVARSTWPIHSDDLWEALNTCFFVLFAASSVIFTLRFCQRRYPRWEAALWIATGAMVLTLLTAPAQAMGECRALVSIAASLIGFTAIILLIVFALRSRVTEQLILAGVQWVSMMAGLHDLLVFLNILHSNVYYSNTFSTLGAISIAAVLAWRYVRSADRIERFNIELRLEVDSALAKLSTSLERQHELELSHARISERQSLVRDLHDGLGSTLVGGIAAIERGADLGSDPASASYLARVLRDVRDDLRLIVDTSAQQPSGEASLSDQLIPLRHRMALLLDAQDIHCHWTMTGLDALHLSSSQVLDVLRFLQEALTNVLKHSGATRVEVRVEHDGSGLRLSVADDGKGLSTAPGRGAGMESMRARARRLGGEFDFASEGGRTVVSVRPLSALRHEPISAAGD